MRSGRGTGKVEAKLGSTRLFLLEVLHPEGLEMTECGADRTGHRPLCRLCFPVCAVTFLGAQFWRGRNVCAHTCFPRKLADGHVQPTELCQAQGHIWPVADSTTTLSLENRPRRGGVSCLKSHKKSTQSRPTYDALEVWGSRLLIISFAQTLHIQILRQPIPELKDSWEVKWAMKKGQHEAVQQLGKTATNASWSRSK